LLWSIEVRLIQDKKELSLDNLLLFFRHDTWSNWAKKKNEEL